MTTYVGKPLPRLEDARFLRGKAKFTDDLRIDGQSFAIVHRSPHAHAVIKAIDTEAARAAPGVLAVLTAADLRAGGMGEIPSLTREVPLPPSNTDGGEFAVASQYPLAEDRVRFVGEPVAFVVAETRDAARDASELIEVDYAPLSAVTTIDDALAEGAPRIWDDRPGNRSLAWDTGDEAATEAAFAAAAHTVELTVEYPREIIAFMEPRSALASFDRDSGRFTLRVGCQSGHVQKALLARILGVDAADIHVIVPETGGGFGARNVTYAEFPLTMFAARLIGRPVAWTAERSESFLTDSQARSQRLTGALALDADGNFTAIRVRAQWWHGGYLLPRSVAVIVMWMAPMTCGPYRISSHHFALEGIFTNTAPMAAYRGVARAEMTYLLERLVDAAAAQTGIDRVELRRRNLIDLEDMPWHSPTGAVYQRADFKRSLEIGLEAIDATSFPARRRASEANGLLRGLGITTYIENAGGALSDFAEVEVCDDETQGVVVHVGTQDFGMGHATVYAQVIADVLGVVPETVKVHDGDTDRIPTGSGSHGSRSMRIGGGGVHQAATAVVEMGRPIAGEMLEAAAADIEFRDGAYVIAGTDRAVGLFEVAAEAARRGAPLVARETFEVPGASYPNGAHLCEVEVDPETGALTLERYVIVSDPGRVINPLLAAGQLHGGLAQGIGQAALERVAYDPATGQLLSGSFMDFALPRADDMPDLTIAFNPVEGDDNPLGVKGIGEGPTTASPPTVVNAVLDALAPRGVTHIDMPLTPETVWRALAASKK
jgi:aerobic carbon-monoxide dehydrogenase large subunit